MGSHSRRAEFCRQDLDIFGERSHIAGARRVLDVGCGTGILVPELLNLYGSATCLVELDLAEDMLRVNSAKFPAQHRPCLCRCADHALL